MLIADRPFIEARLGSAPDRSAAAWAALERSVIAALETYANVHRGSGHHSLTSTLLFEQARDVVRRELGLGEEYVVIFGTAARAAALQARLGPDDSVSVSSAELGLPLGLRALAVKRAALPGGPPAESGGGTVKMVSPGSALWANAPDRFEAGTPPIINAIALARALGLVHEFGPAAFQPTGDDGLTVDDVLYRDEMAATSGRALLAELRGTLIGRLGRVPASGGARPYVHLDNAASTPTFGPIWDAVRRAWRLPEAGRRQVTGEVKSVCARFLGAPPASYEVLFTSNTTEALNLVARQVGRGRAPGEEPVVLNTLLEHNSNELPWRAVPGVSLVRLDVDGEGRLDLGEMERLLRAYDQAGRHGRRRIALVAVSGASNVLGAFNDLAAIGRLAHRYGARLLVDAAQVVAHRRIEMEAWGIDYLAFSGHKVYAPFGTGALVARKGGLHLTAAEREAIAASGEENVGGIAALGKALLLLERIGLDGVEEEERALTRAALAGLAAIPGLTVYGVRDPASPRFASKGGVIAFSLRHVPHNLAAQELAELGAIGTRSGCFCAHLLVKRLLNIHPLRARLADIALWLAPRFTGPLLPGLVRVSLGLENDRHDVDALLGTLAAIARRPRPYGQRLLAAMHNGTPFPPRTAVGQEMAAFSSRVASDVYVPGSPTPEPAYAGADRPAPGPSPKKATRPAWCRCCPCSL